VAGSFYHHELRAIGQALEAEGISTFELKAQVGRFEVSGAPEKPDSLVAALRHWRTNGWRRGPRTVTYNARDINILEKKGQARRAANGRLPDLYNVSSILRTVGSYLDVKNARLLEIQKRPLTLTLTYQMMGGRPLIEDRTIESFYKTFIDLHGMRARPTKL
jgi:hypothetical protein